MSRNSIRRLFGLSLVVTLVSGPFASRHQAASIDESALKAAFLLNFARFTEWAPDTMADGGPLTLCVVGDWFVARSTEETARGKSIGSHPVVVRRMNEDGALRSCQVLYAGRVDVKQALRLLAAVEGASVLTVSDLSNFTLIGGTADLYVDASRIRFAINVDSARRFRVQFSSQLLRLAKLVTTEPGTGKS